MRSKLLWRGRALQKGEGPTPAIVKAGELHGLGKTVLVIFHIWLLMSDMSSISCRILLRGSGVGRGRLVSLDPRCTVY